MGAVAQKIPSAVPSAVTSSNTVAVNSKAQRQPYQPMTGSSHVPYVPGNEDQGHEPQFQPSYGTVGKVGRTLQDGSTGAPSVPVNGMLWINGPIDPHYMVESERNPYAKVNNPKTRGMTTWVKSFANHVFNGKQNVDSAGWQQNTPQQRTSYMRITPPPTGSGYAPQTYDVHLNPQQPRTYKYNPTTGNDAPGVVRGQSIILNTSTYGAGQTAGGLGGNNYTPPAQAPVTTPVQPTASAMPTWG